MRGLLSILLSLILADLPRFCAHLSTPFCLRSSYRSELEALEQLPLLMYFEETLIFCIHLDGGV